MLLVFIPHLIIKVLGNVSYFQEPLDNPWCWELSAKRNLDVLDPNISKNLGFLFILILFFPFQLRTALEADKQADRAPPVLTGIKEMPRLCDFSRQAGKTHWCHEHLTQEAKESNSVLDQGPPEGLGIASQCLMEGVLLGLVFLSPRLGENHAARCHVWEAETQGDFPWGGVREWPAAAQGPIPELLLLCPAGGHTPGPCHCSLVSATATLMPPSLAE